MLTVRIQYRPEYYNHVAKANIPGGYRAEIVRGLPRALRGIRFYADGDTEQEALSILFLSLNEYDVYTGTVRIIREGY